MITFTVDVPEDQVEFFKELMEENGFSAGGLDDDIPLEVMAEVERRSKLSAADPSRLLDWEEVKKSL